MKSILFLLMAVSLVRDGFAAEKLAGWTANLPSAIQAARTNAKPVLVYFTATWCGPCKMMAATTLQDAGVKQRLTSVMPVLIDIDEEPTLSQRYEIQAVPTFVLLNPQEEEIHRRSGYMEATQFGAWLEQSEVVAQKARMAKLAWAKQQTNITAALTGTDPAAAQEAVRQLLELSSHREPDQVVFAAAQLKEVGRREPGWLLEGLNHPKLAARIQVANVFREKLGAQFIFDPWEKEEVRQELIRNWRVQLEKR